MTKWNLKTANLKSLVKYHPNQSFWWKVMAKTPSIFPMCTFWTWPWRYDLGQGWTLWPLPFRWLGSRSLGSWITIVWNISQIKYYSSESGQSLDKDHGYVCNLDLDLEDMTLGHGYGTPLDHGQQLSQILYRSKQNNKKLLPGNWLPYVWIVTFTLEIGPWHTCQVGKVQKREISLFCILPKRRFCEKEIPHLRREVYVEEGDIK